MALSSQGEPARGTAAARAAAAPEQFLARGLGKLVVADRSAPAIDLGVLLPKDLSRLLDVARRRVGPFAPRALPSFASLVAAARRDGLGRGSRSAAARVVALLAGALPFGTTRSGELFVYFLGDTGSPARGVIAEVDPAVPSAPRLLCKGAAPFAVLCAFGSDVTFPPPGVAEQEAIRAAFERGRTLFDLLCGTDAKARRGAAELARKPLDTPSPCDRRKLRGAFVLGPLLEGFFRADEITARAALEGHVDSHDDLVRDGARIALGALAERPRTMAERALAKRRALTLRAARKSAPRSSRASADMSRRIVTAIDATAPESVDREDALLALTHFADRSIVPGLVARAVTGDPTAVEMLGACADQNVVPHLLELLERGAPRALEMRVVGALGTIGGSSAGPALRKMLEQNPMPSWREGLARGTLVRELVTALGELREEAASPLLMDVLEATSQEYRSVLPTAAWALGRLRHLPALGTLERMLSSPKENVSCEVVYAVGAIGLAHPSARAHTKNLLRALSGLEPGADCVRLTALARLGGRDAPRAPAVRRAIDRALWEPAFRREETARRRLWALGALRELASERGERAEFFLGHEAIRYFVTRDDNLVRLASERAFTAWKIELPQVRRYWSVVVEDIERDGGLDALHDAVRDPLGVFRKNVAARISEIDDERSARPLAEATARVFAEPATSTYEYDDAPAELAAFVRALAKMNRREGNDVLIEGLRHGTHQVKAVVAEHAPNDPRFVPELMAMLGDPRSFLRSRAERSLIALGVLPDVHARSGETRIVEV